MAGTFTLEIDGNVVNGLDNVAEMMPVIITRPFDFGFPDKDKYLDSVIFGIENSVDWYRGELHVAYGNRLTDVTPWESTTYTLVRTFTDPSAPIFIRKTARFFSFKLIDRYCRECWRINSIQFWGMPIGVDR